MAVGKQTTHAAKPRAATAHRGSVPGRSRGADVQEPATVCDKLQIHNE